MRNSIKQKLFILIILLLSGFFLSMYLINVYLLDDIFIWNSKKSMTQAYFDFKEKISNGSSVEEVLLNANYNYNSNITILNDKYEILFSSYSRINRYKLERVLPSFSTNLKEFIKNKDQQTMFSVTSEKSKAVKSIVFIGKLKNDLLFIAERPMHVIYDNSRLAGRFIVTSGLVSLIIAFITVYFISIQVTKPIIHINKIAQGIAKLEFSQKVSIKSNDEIGMLGKSINNISSKLSSVLNQLIQSNNKLQNDIDRERKLEKMRRRFVSSVSHELKTPISMIQGYADGLKFNIAKKPEDIQYYCDVIIDESEKMSHLIRDLLHLSSYESGTFNISKSEFDFVELIRNTGEKHLNNLRSKNIKLQMDLPLECLIEADKLRIDQVLSNFMSNAIKHVDKNGMIRIYLDLKKDKVQLNFYNTGKHIDENEMDNIWTSFYKIQSNSYYAASGTGLGLAIVRAIVELHDGSCGVANENEGVRFWIEI